MSVKRLRAICGADGDESREDKNERVDLFEEYNLIKRCHFSFPVSPENPVTVTIEVKPK